jgi:hypothetical protein
MKVVAANLIEALKGGGLAEAPESRSQSAQWPKTPASQGVQEPAGASEAGGG